MICENVFLYFSALSASLRFNLSILILINQIGLLYYTITPESILLTTIYSKSDRRNISNKEVEDIIGQYELEIEQRETEVIETDSEDSDVPS
jgi:hypothetical protein